MTCLPSGRRKAHFCFLLVVDEGHQPGAMGDPTAAGEARARSDGGVNSVCRGNHRGRDRAGGRLKAEVKVSTGGESPTSVGWGMMLLPSKQCANFLLPALVRAADAYYKTRWRRRGAPQQAGAGRFSDPTNGGWPSVDHSEEELMQGLETLVGVDVQWTSDEDFCRQLFRFPKINVSVPVDSTMSMQKRGRGGLTEVLKPDNRQWRADGGGEARQSAVHAEAWQGVD